MVRRKLKRRDATREVIDALHAIMAQHLNEDLTRKQVTQLIVDSGALCSEWVQAIRESAVDREVGRILRSSTFTDQGGTVVRTFQCYGVYMQTEDGREVQQQFWRDIHTMNRKQMATAYRGRIAHARDTKAKADADLAFWNESVAPLLNEKPIEIEE